MKRILVILLFSLMSLLLPIEPIELLYIKFNITELDDGNYTFDIPGYGLKGNQGSSLKKKAFLMNDTSCPVEIIKASVGFEWDGTQFNFKCTTDLQVKKEIAAVEVVHILYDVFGEHMKDFSNLEVEDIKIGSFTLDGVWMTNGNEVSEFLSSATYVKKVLFADGTIWKYNKKNLQGALDYSGELRDGQHFRIENIWFSPANNIYRATLMNIYGDRIYNMTVNDSIAGGKITKIGDNYIIFEKDGEKFEYLLNEED